MTHIQKTSKRLFKGEFEVSTVNNMGFTAHFDHCALKQVQVDTNAETDYLFPMLQNSTTPRKALSDKYAEEILSEGLACPASFWGDSWACTKEGVPICTLKVQKKRSLNHAKYDPTRVYAITIYPLGKFLLAQQ